MELELIENKDFDFNYFKEDFENQKIEFNPEFKKWHENAIKYISEENKKRYRNENCLHHNGLLVISFCNKCKCYVICSFKYDIYSVQCNKCGLIFCIACPRSNNHSEAFCFKGYFKLLSIRTKYRIKGPLGSSENLDIFLTILCILFTPCYLSFASSFISLDDIADINITYNIIYSFSTSFLMFPYVLLFLPFAIVLLIPSLFIPKYYFKLTSFYTSLFYFHYTRADLDT